jgi:hypothetical protein
VNDVFRYEFNRTDEHADDKSPITEWLQLTTDASATLPLVVGLDEGELAYSWSTKQGPPRRHYYFWFFGYVVRLPFEGEAKRQYYLW